MLKMSYENTHNLLKAMYCEWDIGYDTRGHNKRIYRKASKKAPKKGMLLATSNVAGCLPLRIIINSMKRFAKIIQATHAKRRMYEMFPL